MSSRQQFREHVRISSADDFSSSYSPSYSSGTSDAVQSIVTSRKCWKTIKGKGEVVWPPYLEAALVEGELYFIRILCFRLTELFSVPGSKDSRNTGQ